MPRHWTIGFCACLASACTQEAKPPLVLLISMDTLRADALSCYGNPRLTTPNLDAEAREGVLFEQVYANAPSTAPSHATLFTGLFPYTHRVANLTSHELGTPGLAPEFTTLAEILQKEGYFSAAFTDDGPLGRAFNLMQGFELLEARYQEIDVKLQALLDFVLNDGAELAPLFLFLHSYQAHMPYLPPLNWMKDIDAEYGGPLRQRVADLRQRTAAGELIQDSRLLMEGRDQFEPRDFQYLRELYEAEVSFADHELGRLLVALRDKGWFEQSLICLTSDHGEEFGEHGHYGHSQLYAETLRVPLLLKLPHGRFAGKRYTHPVSLIDLHSTLLDALGLEPASGVEKRSLLPYLAEDLDPARALFANTNEHLCTPFGITLQRSSLRAEGYALLREADTKQPQAVKSEIFDSALDPGELAALDITEPVLRGRQSAMGIHLDQHLQQAFELSRHFSGGSGEIYLQPGDAATEAQMRALGYLDRR